MKTLEITTKREAMALTLNSLFSGPTTHSKPKRLDRGKYNWTGSARDYVGKPAKVPNDVVAVWVERRTDQHGPYAALMCITNPSI